MKFILSVALLALCVSVASAVNCYECEFNWTGNGGNEEDCFPDDMEDLVATEKTGAQCYNVRVLDGNDLIKGKRGAGIIPIETMEGVQGDYDIEGASCTEALCNGASGPTYAGITMALATILAIRVL